MNFFSIATGVKPFEATVLWLSPKEFKLFRRDVEPIKGEWEIFIFYEYIGTISRLNLVKAAGEMFLDYRKHRVKNAARCLKSVQG